MVLNEICDDYENVDQIILPQVAQNAVKCGLVIERSEIVEALAGLIQDGMAKAYLLSTWSRSRLNFKACRRSMSSRSTFETYFFVTKKGIEFPALRRLLVAFDDSGELRPDWHLDVLRDLYRRIASRGSI